MCMKSLDVRSGMLGAVAGAGLAYLLFKEAKGGARLEQKVVEAVGGTTVSGVDAYTEFQLNLMVLRWNLCPRSSSSTTHSHKNANALSVKETN